MLGWAKKKNRHIRIFIAAIQYINCKSKYQCIFLRWNHSDGEKGNFCHPFDGYLVDIARVYLLLCWVSLRHLYGQAEKMKEQATCILNSQPPPKHLKIKTRRRTKNTNYRYGNRSNPTNPGIVMHIFILYRIVRWVLIPISNYIKQPSWPQ